MSAGPLQERVAFDMPTLVADGRGGNERTFSEEYRCAAHFKYVRGREAVDAGGLTGTAVFKVKIRSCLAALRITADYRMRDVRRGLSYNVIDMDNVTDRDWVWLTVEAGVAI